MNLPVLGAWLHDIGKFAQRANAPRSNQEHEYCPTRGGHSSHQHVLHTDYFIENILPLPEELESSRGYLAGLAASHHKAESKSREHQAIQRADCLSSGLDRTESEREGNYKTDRLQSIFQKVRLGGIGVPSDAPPLSYNLLPLGDGDAIFPVASSAGADYKSLWASFLEELKTLPRDWGIAAWQASLISLLERYCWCIPSATWKSLPDVSLYDHGSTTAALTQALLHCEPGQEKFLLYGADLSGIQSFIFGTEVQADKGASKLLRARSFLLQALTRSCWLALLERLNLDSAAKIMDAGGRFALLLPDSPQIHEQLDRLELEAEKWLLDKFQGSIRLNFARLALCAADLNRKVFSSCFESFNEELEKSKLQPFSRVLAAGLLPYPREPQDYGKYGECAFCRINPAKFLEDGQPICNLCSQLLKLGKNLPKTAFVVFTRRRENSLVPDGCLFNAPNLLFDGINLRLYEKIPPEQEIRHALQILSIKGQTIFTAAPIAGHIPMLSREDLERLKKEERIEEKDGANFFMGAEIEAGEPKTFALLAEEARMAPKNPDESWSSIAALAICKADVDNLGLIFSLGLARNFSLSAYAMLARMLNHFFAGYLPSIIRKKFPNIYIVFAGGDDVFVIGPWDSAIEFGMRMALDFRKFCGENPAVTISAGMPLVKADLPMRGMREAAENALEQSKSWQGDKFPADEKRELKRSKNAATLFGATAHWDEAAILLQYGKWLAKLCRERLISVSFLRRMLEYSRQCREFYSGKHLVENGLYLSHFSYDLARNRENAPILPKNSQDPAAFEELRQSREKEYGQLQKLVLDKKLFSKAEMGLSWAIYKNRK